MPVTMRMVRAQGRDTCQPHGVLGRDDILAVVAKEFAHWGYHGTDMDHVAQALDWGKGTVYRYFRGKEELFLAAVDLGLRRLREAVAASASEAQGPREQVARAISTCVTFFDAHPEFAELLIEECAEFPGRRRRTWLTIRDALGPSQTLDRNRRTHGSAPFTLAERSHDLVSVVVCGAVFSRCLTGRSGGLEFWVQKVLDIVLSGILSDAAQATAGCRVTTVGSARAASEGPPLE
jgi:AcrR family transcriptional regulator